MSMNTATHVSPDPQQRLYKRWSPHRRLQAAAELYQFAKEVIRTRERRRFPELSEQKLEERIRSLFA